ncbi:MAG: DNA alkylation repair protein [Candidatus Wolfebacteria bacterium]|nr:DNA alkylation repair protein [Candidatus Wolfebacteria bacterium]
MLTLSSLRKELRSNANPKRAEFSKRYFKCGPGEYGEGDVFMGLTITTGELRKIAKSYLSLSFPDLQELLNSKFHEERQFALMVLVYKYGKSGSPEKKKIFDFYLKNTKHINNWDLVDLSAPNIVGEYLLDKPRGILYKLAKSKNLWEKRIAVLATFAFIKEGQFTDSFKIAEILLDDSHDLIHKAVGWMLREVGKKFLADEEKFLKKRYKKMPRTMLRYAIEKFPEKKRKAYLAGRI